MALIKQTPTVNLPFGLGNNKNADTLFRRLQDTTGMSTFPFVRNGVKNVEDGRGILVPVAANKPAVEFRDGVNRGLWIEPSATNLIQWSEDFTRTPWVKGSNVTIRSIDDFDLPAAANIQSIPDRVAHTFPIDPRLSVTVTSSIIIPPASKFSDSTVSIRITQSGAPNVVASITPTDNYQRVVATQTFTTGGTNSTVIITADKAVTVTERFRVQVEVGPVATSYIKTEASSLTRPQDVATITNAQDLIGQTEGTVLVEVDIKNLLGNVSRNVINISSGAVSNRIDLSFTSSATNELRLFVTSGGVARPTLTVKTITNTGKYRVGITYGSFGYKTFVNGELTASSTSTGISALSTSVIGIGTRPFTPEPFNDSISQALIFKQALSDNEVRTWTTL